MSDFMIQGLIFQDLGWRVYKVRAGAAAGVSDEQEQTAAIFRSLTHSLSLTHASRTSAFIGKFKLKFGSGCEIYQNKDECFIS